MASDSPKDVKDATPDAGEETDSPSERSDRLTDLITALYRNRENALSRQGNAFLAEYYRSAFTAYFLARTNDPQRAVVVDQAGRPVPIFDLVRQLLLDEAESAGLSDVAENPEAAERVFKAVTERFNAIETPWSLRFDPSQPALRLEPKNLTTKPAHPTTEALTADGEDDEELLWLATALLWKDAHAAISKLSESLDRLTRRVEETSGIR